MDCRSLSNEARSEPYALMNALSCLSFSILWSVSSSVQGGWLHTGVGQTCSLWLTPSTVST